MKREAPLPLSELYRRMSPLDKLALLYFVDEMRKGRQPSVTTRYGHNAAIVLSYSHLVHVRQTGDNPPRIVYITSRGMAMSKHILAKTTTEELASQLPEDVRKKMRPSA